MTLFIVSIFKTPEARFLSPGNRWNLSPYLFVFSSFLSVFVPWRHCVLVARPRRCLTLTNPVTWQNWMAAYLGYTLRMRTLFRGWPIMVNDTHTRRRLCYYMTWERDDVPCCRILPLTKLNGGLSTLCGWRRCFVAVQLWFMTHIREEEDCVIGDVFMWFWLTRWRH